MTVSRPYSMFAAVMGTALALVFATGAALSASTPSVATDAKVYIKPKPLPPFSLQDAEGKLFSNEQLKGKWSLVLLGFTHCPDICPFTLQNLAHVKHELSTRVSPERLPQIIFVGVDPDRDRPVLADYVRHFDDRIVGVTGVWAEIEKVVEGLDGFVRITGKKPGAQAYDVRHSAVISLISPEGNLIAGINPPLKANEASIFIAETMLHHSRQQKEQK